MWADHVKNERIYKMNSRKKIITTLFVIAIIIPQSSHLKPAYDFISVKKIFNALYQNEFKSAEIIYKKKVKLKLKYSGGYSGNYKFYTKSKINKKIFKLFDYPWHSKQRGNKYRIEFEFEISKLLSEGKLKRGKIYTVIFQLNGNYEFQGATDASVWFEIGTIPETAIIEL